MKLLYCSDAFDKRTPDSVFADEHAAAVANGLSIALLDGEEFERGQVRCRPQLSDGDAVLYRGWMLNPQRYASLEANIAATGARMITSAADFRHCHHLPEWYPLCTDFTPRTVVLRPDADFERELPALGWTAYFVKDYVKSLTTTRGSVARTPAEVREVLALIEKYRGEIEGGVCIREFEALIVDSEERFFAFGQSVHSRDGSPIPAEVVAVAERINRPFYSIDVARRADGALRLIEIGDGQVSDRKKWTAERFIQVLAVAAGSDK